MTIKELSAELGVSEQALRQWCKKNNVRKERTQATKASYVLTFDVVESIKKHYLSEKSNESNESKATKEHNKSNESNESVAILSELQHQSAALTAQLEAAEAERERLLSQVDELRADKQALIELTKKLTAQLENEQAERKAERLERQTLLSELLQLRGQKVIEVKPEATDTVKAAERQRTAPRSERQERPQQPRQAREYKKPPTMLERLKRAFMSK